MRSFRFFAALAVLLVPVSAWALSCPSLPVSFVTNTIIQAPDFNSDFIDLYDCLEGALSGYTGAVSNGTSNAQTVTYTNGPSTYSTGTIYSFIVGSGLTNTGAATVNINGLGAKSVEIDGQPLVGGEMAAGTSVALMYDGTFLQLLASPAARTPAPNILINGAVDLDQENEGAAVAFINGGVNFGPDEWELGGTTAANGITIQRVSWTGNAAAPESLLFSHAVQVTIATGSATVGSGDWLDINNVIEGQNLAASGEGTAAAKSLSLSFCLESSVADATISVGLRSSNENQSFRAYMEPITLGAANTPVCTGFVIPGDTAGTWSLLGNSARGADVVFGLEAGVGQQMASGNWVTPPTADAAGTGGQTQLTTITGATLTITGVKLELSPVPTPFVRLAFGEELARAQRYYQKSYDIGTAPGTATTVGNVAGIAPSSSPAGGIVNVPVFFKTTMRCDPTITLYSPVNGASGEINAPTGGDNAAASADYSQMTGFSAFTNNSGGTLTGPFDFNFQYTADCRI